MSKRNFLTAYWKHLLMLNYEVDPQILLPRVPPHCELDLFECRAMASMVGFLFLDTKVLGLGIPFHRDFEEINLRFYVRSEHEGEWRRGVVFVKEIVPRLAIAGIARWLYGEQYFAMPTGHRIDFQPSGEPSSLAYEWRHHGSWESLAATVSGPLGSIVAGSEEEFITEHYWGYTALPGGHCREYQVTHPQWKVWPVSEARLHCDIERLYGADFVEALSAEPTSAFLADGSPISVKFGRKL